MPIRSIPPLPKPRRVEHEVRRKESGKSEIALRLAIGREGIGLELASPTRVECLTVTQLEVALPGIRFPVDVSGGVPRFRHRRGQLQRMEVEVTARTLERWAAPKLRGLVSTRAPNVWIALRRGAATVCVSAPGDVDEEMRSAPVVAFEVHVIADGQDFVLVVEHARGDGLPAPPTAVAVACMQSLLGRAATRRGAVFVVSRAATALARVVLPEAGARVPAAGGVSWTSVAVQGDTWIAHALQGAVSDAPSDDALLAREIATLLGDADDALLSGDTEEARALYLEGLERAPRHAEIVRRIVAIDARTAGRAEAALAMLSEAAGKDGRTPFGTTPGELLAEIGDVDAAVASLESAADAEPAPVLAARAFQVAAALTPDAEEAGRKLDRATARAPREAMTRWMRVERRLQLGRLEDATADVEHLEALARGGPARHAVWVRAGRAWQAAGLRAQAGEIFERALRYTPDEPRALAGFGASLVAAGRPTRGAAILARAIELAEARGEPSSPMVLDLAEALAERLDDAPSAVARVAAIPAESPDAPIARGLEGRWRARLDDLAGASLAFARLRELSASFPASTDDPRAPAMVALLKEAARFARSRVNDPLSAQRYLAAVLRLRPHDVEARQAFREVGAALAGRTAVDDSAIAFESPEAESATHRTVTERPSKLDLALAPDPRDEDPGAVALADELARRLQANPSDDSVADELAAVLESLGRGHELVALLSARLEDATPEHRATLAPRARVAFERMAAQAEAAGRVDEAALYRSAADALREH